MPSSPPCCASAEAELAAWRPASCSLVAWDAAGFCSLLGRRKLLWVGDSTALQSAIALSSELRSSSTAVSCGQHQISFALSDTLVGRSFSIASNASKHGQLGLNRGYPLPTIVEHAKPAVVVLSVGAHVYREGSFEQMLEGAAHDVAALRTRLPNLTVIWKTSTLGACAQDDYGWRTFNYAMYAHFDALARRFWPPRNVSVLDVSPLHTWRGEGACDVHLCAGPLRLVPHLLYHALATGGIPLY